MFIREDPCPISGFGRRGSKGKNVRTWMNTDQDGFFWDKELSVFIRVNQCPIHSFR